MLECRWKEALIRKLKERMDIYSRIICVFDGDTPPIKADPKSPAAKKRAK